MSENVINDKNELIKRIQERKKKLKKASKELKEYFVGLDSIIDKIFADLETWYIMPELMTRPVIICLFGPTGVGKTDLVRRLVKAIGFSDRYCEIELANKSSSWARNVGSLLHQSPTVESGSPSIILLDEIQGFRTIDEQGSEIHDYDMKDIWTLLSDGKLPFRAEVESLMSMLWDYKKKTKNTKRKQRKHVHTDGVPRVAKKMILSRADSILDDIDFGEEDEEDDRQNYYTLSHFKSVLRLSESIDEIAQWSDEKKKQMILQKMNDNSIYDELDYTKSLIFISGNLDEAYGFTRNAKEVDIDADILYERSKKISILDIKEALCRRFRPEQISRMGNMQIIYPSLSKKSFEEIIQRKINSIKTRVKQQTEIDLEIDPSINEIIYNNGVFPTQGTRPLFSTISEILESILPEFLLKALIKDAKQISISYEKDHMVARISELTFKSRYIGSLDLLKNKHNNNLNRKALSAVHESAHAIIHAILLNYSPSQICSTPVSEDMEGFIYSQENCNTKDMLNRRICVLLAGQEAEKIVFGSAYQTSGCSEDLRKATALAAGMVRRWGMSCFQSRIGEEQSEKDANNNLEQTNSVIENIVKSAACEAKEIIVRHNDLFMDVVDRLMSFEKLNPEEFVKICKKHGVEASVPNNSEDVIYWDFYGELKKFKENKT